MLKIFFMQNIYLEILLIIFIFSKKMYCNILCQRCCGEKEYIRIEKVFGDAIENGAADGAIDKLKDDISDIQEIFGYIKPDLKHHHKGMSFKIADDLLKTILENRMNIRDNMNGFIRWNGNENTFEYFKTNVRK